LIALLVLAQEQVLELQQVQEPQQVPAQESQLALALAQELGLVPVQQLEPEPVQVPQQVLASVLVQHLHHQLPLSRCQLQQSHLQQHEFLSILQQLATALRYQLCL
jgi:hypothetical protein